MERRNTNREIQNVNPLTDERGVSARVPKPRVPADRQHPTANSQPSVLLHIGELVLEGSPWNAQHIPVLKVAIEAELACLMARGGFVPASRRAERIVSEGEIRLPPDATPQQWGKRIAQQICRACKPPDATV
jgi:hypothetical protein